MSSITLTNKKTGKSVTLTPKPGTYPPIGGWPIKRLATGTPYGNALSRANIA